MVPDQSPGQPPREPPRESQSVLGCQPQRLQKNVTDCFENGWCFGYSTSSSYLHHRSCTCVGLLHLISSPWPKVETPTTVRRHTLERAPCFRPRSVPSGFGIPRPRIEDLVPRPIMCFMVCVMVAVYGLFQFMCYFVCLCLILVY